MAREGIARPADQRQLVQLLLLVAIRGEVEVGRSGEGSRGVGRGLSVGRGLWEGPASKEAEGCLSSSQEAKEETAEEAEQRPQARDVQWKRDDPAEEVEEALHSPAYSADHSRFQRHSQRVEDGAETAAQSDSPAGQSSDQEVREPGRRPFVSQVEVLQILFLGLVSAEQSGKKSKIEKVVKEEESTWMSRWTMGGEVGVDERNACRPSARLFSGREVLETGPEAWGGVLETASEALGRPESASSPSPEPCTSSGGGEPPGGWPSSLSSSSPPPPPPPPGGPSPGPPSSPSSCPPPSAAPCPRWISTLIGMMMRGLDFGFAFGGVDDGEASEVLGARLVSDEEEDGVVGVVGVEDGVGGVVGVEEEGCVGGAAVDEALEVEGTEAD